MAKAKGKRKAPSPIEELDGPTPEQLGKGGYDRLAMPNPDGGNRAALVHINRGFEENGRVFKTLHLDRLHKAGQFSDAQYEAGVWYRDQHERGRYGQPQMSNLYRVQGGTVTSITDWTQDARDRWRAARACIPADMVGFMDALLLRNRWPKMHHRERFRTIERIRDALDCICIHIGTKRG